MKITGCGNLPIRNILKNTSVNIGLLILNMWQDKTPGRTSIIKINIERILTTGYDRKHTIRVIGPNITRKFKDTVLFVISRFHLVENTVYFIARKFTKNNTVGLCVGITPGRKRERNMPKPKRQTKQAILKRNNVIRSYYKRLKKTKSQYECFDILSGKFCLAIESVRNILWGRHK